MSSSGIIPESDPGNAILRDYSSIGLLPDVTRATPPYGRGVSDNEQSIIEATALTMRYRGGTTALNDLTLSVRPGITGLVGANGAGKSTLIKILLGLLTPTSGQVRVLGMDAREQGEQIRARVGYMPEHDCLPADVTATEFVTHLGRMSGLPPTAAKEQAAEALRHVGLHEERYRQIGTFSTGMKQRVKLAQALVGDPGLLLLDEPTNGLDPAGRDAMLALIHRIGTEFGIAVVVASHLLSEIERICDHLVAIEGGKLLRAASLDSMTQALPWLAVEVDEGTDLLAARLTELGLTVSPLPARRQLLVRLDGEPVFDTVRDTIADLELPLTRLEHRRHHVEELFAEAMRRLQDRPDSGRRPRCEHHANERHPRHRIQAVHRSTAGPRADRPRPLRAQSAQRLRPRPRAQSEARALVRHRRHDDPGRAQRLRRLHATALVLDYADLGYDLMLFSVLFVAVAAPELVSRDLRHHTLPLYFSRPLRRGDYPLAKLLALFSSLLLVEILPVLITYVGQIASAKSGHEIWLDSRAAFPAVFVAFFQAALFSSISLLMASSTGRRVIATGAIAILFLVTSAISHVFSDALGRTWADHTVSCTVPMVDPKTASGRDLFGVGGGINGPPDFAVSAAVPRRGHQQRQRREHQRPEGPEQARLRRHHHRRTRPRSTPTSPRSAACSTRSTSSRAPGSGPSTRPTARSPTPPRSARLYGAEMIVLVVAAGGGLFLRYRKVSVS